MIVFHLRTDEQSGRRLSGILLANKGRTRQVGAALPKTHVTVDVASKGCSGMEQDAEKVFASCNSDAALSHQDSGGDVHSVLVSAWNSVSVRI
jgi:hypothetical protein